MAETPKTISGLERIRPIANMNRVFGGFLMEMNKRPLKSPPAPVEDRPAPPPQASISPPLE
jgi:hypothetical protein